MKIVTKIIKKEYKKSTNRSKLHVTSMDVYNKVVILVCLKLIENSNKNYKKRI